jgi:hypothetical protein
MHPGGDDIKMKRKATHSGSEHTRKRLRIVDAVNLELSSALTAHNQIDGPILPQIHHRLSSYSVGQKYSPAIEQNTVRNNLFTLCSLVSHNQSRMTPTRELACILGSATSLAGQ